MSDDRLVLTLYGKPDCSLCDKMKAVIERVQARVAFEVRGESILDDPKLWERHWKDIPVLAYEGRVLFRHKVTEEALATAVGELRRSMGSGSGA